MSDVIKMTDRSPTKVIECAYVGCTQLIEVTKFASPTKSKCPEHQGRRSPPPSMDPSIPKSSKVDSGPVERKPLDKILHGQALGELRCPMDGEPMEVLAVSDGFGEVVFGCPLCNLGVTIAAEWRIFQIKSVPEGFRPFVERFHETQKMLATRENPFATIAEGEK